MSILVLGLLVRVSLIRAIIKLLTIGQNLNPGNCITEMPNVNFINGIGLV